jgi:hypothetical protein
MDGRRFDALTMAIGPASRRAALRFAAGAGFAALLTQSRLEETAARCRKPGKKCKSKGGKKRKCCGGAKCKGHTCRCPQGQIGAGEQCVTGQGTCADGTDACVDGFATPCNGNPSCFCQQSDDSGTRCGMFAGTCGDCVSDGDCAAHGPGAFCLKTTPACCNPVLGTTICGVPCPTT